MGQLQEVRSSCGEEEAKVNSLRRELQDTSRELSEALSTINRQVNTHTTHTHSHTRTHTHTRTEREFRLVFYWLVLLTAGNPTGVLAGTDESHVTRSRERPQKERLRGT